MTNQLDRELALVVLADAGRSMIIPAEGKFGAALLDVAAEDYDYDDPAPDSDEDDEWGRPARR